MKKALKFGSPVLTIALFAVAGILLLGSSIGGARAALTYYSETYTSRIEMYDIGVTLNENGKAVSNRDYKEYSNGKWDEGTGALLVNRWAEGSEETFKLGTAYPEVISATNSGSIDEYVRITLYTYWVTDNEKEDEKHPTLSPALIKLHADEANLGTHWLKDEKASTLERNIYYYNKILKVGETTPALTDTLTIDGDVITERIETENGYRVTTTYTYNGVKFIIEAEVDAVQTHNAEDAILSAWGRKVRIRNDRLSLID